MAVLLTSAAPYVSAERAQASQYLVGFQQKLPDYAKRGGKLYDEDVARVDDTLAFAVVTVHGDAKAFEARAHSDPNVRYVSLDRSDAVRPFFAPNDPYYSQQYAYARMNAPAAWNATLGSASVIVAVLDTGVDRAHPDLAGARMLQGYDFVAGDLDPNDDCGHGTHVAGILGATANNGVGIAGAAQVSILPIKVMSKDPTTGSCSGPFSAVASGIHYATDQGARVISMSLGCVGCFDQSTKDAIDHALAHNVLLVASAGNSGSTCGSCVAWPAADAGVMAVACTDQTDLQCAVSSSGAEVEISAPGKNIYSTVPGGSYMSMTGTSMSAPAVAGAAGLAFSVNAALSGAQMRSLIDSTARDLGAAGRDAAFGYGIVDMGALVAAAAQGQPTSAPVNAAPTASFTWSASTLTLSVNGTASRDSEGSLTSYSWSWGDGSPSSSGATASHAYASGGSYAVQLTVTDNASATGSTTQTITVSAPVAAKVHVGDITGGVSSAKSGTKFSWTAPTLTATGATLAGATVSATISWTGGSQTTSAVAASNGLASFTLQQKRVASGSVYTLCVTSVSASGYAYDASANVETCQALVAP